MLLTQPRIEALSRISRFAGWTNRPYSVLEHSLIGAKLLSEYGYDLETQKAFMLHDLHETAFGGDITTPIKIKYMSPKYREDVKAWDDLLTEETGVAQNADVTHMMDAVMLAAETRTVFTGGWKAPVAAENYLMKIRAEELINYGFYSSNLSIPCFWEMWTKQ